MDVYPIVHKNAIFNIITDYDISFVEIRKLLDYLLEENAFNGELIDENEPRLYEIYIGSYHYLVDVAKYEVAIYKRESKIKNMEI
ncbi:MAG: hypothetical protein M1381_02735 [Deltaproteobacteria bacterium]|nr:hypothetical protein [Deltaproteobacteria bacterium]MCL5792002.1 hypothetical protein [Deltaproteobacteria bacterium]